MKTQTLLILTVLLAWISPPKTYSQEFKLATYTEVTRVSPKAGLSLGVQLPLDYGKIEIGSFYQSELMDETTEQFEKIKEKTFYGMYASLFIVEKTRYDIQLHIRTGAVNGEYFTITPAVKSEFRLLKRLSVIMGAGVRNLHPTWMTGLVITL